MWKIKLDDFLPKEVEVETKNWVITLYEPTIEDLVEIQKLSKEIEKGSDELEISISILWLLAKDKANSLKELLRKMPYSKLMKFQQQIFKELGLGQADEVNETMNK